MGNRRISVFNQDNLVVVDKRTLWAIIRDIEHQQFPVFTANSIAMSDSSVSTRKTADGRYLTVVHYVQHDNGIKLTYKVDKDLYRAFLKFYERKLSNTA